MADLEIKSIEKCYYIKENFRELYLLNAFER